MDPALLKAREAFKKKAFATPVIEAKRPVTSNQESGKESNKKPRKSAPAPVAEKTFDFKKYKPSSNANFACLAKIVKYMKQRYLDGDNEPLTLEDMLDETNQLDLAPRQRQWLATEALKNNPKVDITEDGQKYFYKPTFPLKDKKSLLRLLDKYDQRGQGGIPLEDIQESLPNADRCIKALGEAIIMLTRPTDKKKILYYNDRSIQFKVDDEFQKFWRTAAVDGLDDAKIEEYLEKHGITSMKDVGGKNSTPMQKRKKPTSKKPRNFKKHNEHMGDILQDYNG
ncbi:general transcription factor IIE subunit 2-like [Panonychus citri]|uniref:general transcription factor IIE subunit 2-like n=1 Tax=Panonychus citri TaxID=50023 RepID=UPI002307F056|nr:general transcription factor IIE subunit 2-like [Panonychus citri]